MSDIYRRLTFRDLREGAIIYWRLSASFWINYFVGLIFILISISAFDKTLSVSVYRHFQIFLTHSWIILLVLGAFIAILIPPLVKMTRFLDLSLESHDMKEKYLMLASLDRFNRGIVIVASVVVLYLFQRNKNEGWMLLLVLLLVLALTALLSMAIYGWMSHQFKDS